MKTITLTSEKGAELDTEIRFLVATERASGTELIRFDIRDGEGSALAVRLAVKILRRMRSEGAIQVYATRESFLSGDTEASYILNKYYDSFMGELPEHEYIFVKI